MAPTGESKCLPTRPSWLNSFALWLTMREKRRSISYRCLLSKLQRITLNRLSTNLYMSSTLTFGSKCAGLLSRNLNFSHLTANKSSDKASCAQIMKSMNSLEYLITHCNNSLPNTSRDYSEISILTSWGSSTKNSRRIRMGRIVSGERLKSPLSEIFGPRLGPSFSI